MAGSHGTRRPRCWRRRSARPRPRATGTTASRTARPARSRCSRASPPRASSRRGARAARGRGLVPARGRAAAPAGPGRYPAWQPSDAPGPPASLRLAWCYGDLGVAAALLGAGLHAVRAGLARRGPGARARVRGALRRRGDRHAGLCHGAAGIAHLLNRMAQATGDAALEDAARALDRSRVRAAPRGRDRRLPVRSHRGRRHLVRRRRDGPDRRGRRGARAARRDLRGRARWDRLLLVDFPVP